MTIDREKLARRLYNHWEGVDSLGIDDWDNYLLDRGQEKWLALADLVLPVLELPDPDFRKCELGYEDGLPLVHICEPSWQAHADAVKRVWGDA